MSDYFNEEKRIQGIKERFEKQKNYRLTPVDFSLTPGKEYYTVLSWNNDGQKKINFSTSYYNGKIYYIEQGYVFESNSDGTEQRILITINEYFKTSKVNTIYNSKIFLEVNSTGIYLQHFEKKVTVLRFSLEGMHRKTVQLNGRVIKPYIYGTRIYYVLVKGATKEVLRYYDMNTDADVMVAEASSVLDFCANGDKAVAKVRFEKTKQGTVVREIGWYIYDLKKEESVCLSSENAQPHRVWKYIDEFIEGSAKYVPDKERINIRWVDLARNIMWIASPYREVAENGVKTQEYWEAFELKYEGEPIADAPIWRITPSQLVSSKNGYAVKDASYFDGNSFLNGRGLTTMKSYNVEGDCVDYATRTNGGACNKFRVLNGYVYADFEHAGFEQYRLENEKMEYVRDCWFAREHMEMSKEVGPLNIDEYINEYKNRDK